MSTSNDHVSGDWGKVAQDWRESLVGLGRAKATVQLYTAVIGRLADWAKRNLHPAVGPLNIRPHEISDYLDELSIMRSAATVDIHYRALRVFFQHLVQDGQIRESPMGGVKPVHVEIVNFSLRGVRR